MFLLSERIKTMVRNIIIEDKTYDLLKNVYKDSLLYFLLHIPFFKRKINLQDDTIFIMRTIKWKPFGYLFYNKEIVYFPETKLHFTLYLCSENEYKEAQKLGYITNLLIYNVKDTVIHS